MRSLTRLLFVLSAFMPGFPAATEPAAAALAPARLRCESLSDPLGIDAVPPRLSWAVESPRRGDRQTAYRILAASSPDLLAAGTGDLWDTGEVKSDETLHLPYAGKPLASGQAVHWKVRVWDRDGRPSAWSAPARWEMGLLRPEDWQGARWVGDPRPPDGSSAPLYRNEFTLDKPVASARAYLCGLGYHELILNGVKAGDATLDPAFTRYDRRCLYVTHDVTANLRPGRNAAGVMLGNGWMNMHADDVWEFHKAPWRARPMFLLLLRVRHPDGSETLVRSGEGWTSAPGPIVSDCIRVGESYDARREQPGWDTPTFDASGWTPAAVVDGPKGLLSAQAMPPIRVTETLRPVSVTEPKPGVFVFDLGRNIPGRARITVAGPAGATVSLKYGERLAPDGTVDQKAIHAHVKSPDFQTDRYTLKGERREMWEARFVYHGFQYVEASGWPVTEKDGKPVKPGPDNLEGRVVHTDFERIGEFECSSDLFNAIQRCTLWSYRGNYHGYPTDCPHREKNGWTGDAHFAIGQALYNFDNTAAYAKWMNDFKDEQRDAGDLPGIVPTGGWGYAWGNGPAWDSAYLIIPWSLHVHTGDTRILESHLDRWKRYVDYLTAKSKNRIVSIGLGDWVPVNAKTPVEVTSTGYYYADARIVARAARLLGRTEDAERYDAIADEIRAAFRKYFYDPDTGFVANGTQTAQSCALIHGFLDPPDRERALAALVENVGQRGGHLDAGVLGTIWLLHALTDHGRADTAYTVAGQKTFPSWGHWIAQGATTLWEDMKGEASLNHIFMGDISAWFHGSVAGIRPDPEKPGYKHIVFKPHPGGDLTWARSEVRTVRGTVASRWDREGDALALTVTVPANCTGTVHLPAGESAKATVDGKPAEGAEGVTFLRREGDRRVYAVESGEYRFRVGPSD
jgi:alpha-L-rhamnosidase